MALSSASYVIYLLHTTFEGFAKAVLAKVGFPVEPDLFFIAGAIVVIAFGIAIPMLLYKFLISRFKGARFFFGLS